MAFDINKFVKVPAFLQFVGMFLILGMLLLIHAHGFIETAAKVGAFLADGVAFAGYLYDKIYQ
jgi:hypothetical protein